MWPFKPKYKRIEDQSDEDVLAESASKDSGADQIQQISNSKLAADLSKLTAQFEQFAELRKLFNERFTRINEQVGELRGMIMDSNRAMQDVEVKTVKAVDLVSAVQPDKLMVEIRKQDVKIEALKASFESNEAMMKSILDQLKDMRHTVSKFKGVESVVKLSDDVKKELMNIKKSEATIERHSDKVEGIFMESQKRFQDFESLSGKLTDMDKEVKKIMQQSDQNRAKASSLATKKEVENLISKFNDFEKHVGNVIDLVAKKSNDLPLNLNDRFKKLEKSINKAFDERVKKAEKMNRILSRIEEKAPIIAKELKIAEAIEKEDANRPKITTEKQSTAAAKPEEKKEVEEAKPAAAADGEEPAEGEEKKKNLFGKVFKKKEAASEEPKEQEKKE
ncbi:MAG: hypothetical protein KKF44_04555 [Nanoarchaeota archaeon]|nr:hypothetical protein [Nanoarchaeota archaeon]